MARAQAVTRGRAIPVTLAEPLVPAAQDGVNDPPWLKVGADVFLSTYGWGSRGEHIIKCKVARITKTMVVMDDKWNTRVSRHDLVRRSSDSWGSNTYLYSADDPRRRATYYKQWRKTIRTNTKQEVQKLLDSWETTGATEDSDAIVELIEQAQNRIAMIRKQEREL